MLKFLLISLLAFEFSNYQKKFQGRNGLATYFFGKEYNHSPLFENPITKGANFGLYELYDCNCVNDEQCEKETGSCVNGCSEKWSGPSCQKQCNVGTYGSDCSNFCYCLNGVGCSDNGVCPNGCRNGWQGPNCNIEVAPNNFLIFTDTQEKAIIRLDVTSRGYMTLPITSHNNPIAIDFDPKESRIYWTDVLSKQIRRASLAGESATLIRQLNNVSIPDGIAVDSLNRLIFYTDTGNDLIAKMAMDGSSHLEIIKTGLDEPRAIVLDTNNKKIYWTDWGLNAKIMSADYDGNNQKTLISTGLKWPNGLALDFTNNRMFWTDAGTKKIETATIEGSGRRTLLSSNTAHYFGIAYHENAIYFTDWTQKSVMKVSFNGAVAVKIERFGPAVFGRLNDLHMYVNQGDENACHNNNTYGAGCIKRCNDRHCEGSQYCNAITGECLNGCKSGYEGQDCTIVCPNGRFGIGCSRLCSARNCKLSTECHHVNGKCEDGCSPGFTGIDCTVECSRGFYGADCASNCLTRHCTDQSNCNSRDGACNCIDGYEGVDCTIKKLGNIDGPSKPAEIYPTWIIVGTVLGLVIGICIGVVGTMLVSRLRSNKDKAKIVYNASTGQCNLYNNNVTTPQPPTATAPTDNNDSSNYDTLSFYNRNDEPYQKF